MSNHDACPRMSIPRFADSPADVLRRAINRAAEHRDAMVLGCATDRPTQNVSGGIRESRDRHAGAGVMAAHDPLPSRRVSGLRASRAA